MPEDKILIISTHEDNSLALFKAASDQLQPIISYYSDYQWQLAKLLETNYFKALYLRDPFNDPTVSIDDIERVLDQIAGLPFEYIVDNTSSLDDLMMEDKWQQYQKLAKFMPPTSIVRSFSQVNFKDCLIKKRLSSRSRDIVMDLSDVPEGANPTDYIKQPRLTAVAPELRVNMIGHQIIQPLGIRSPKTPHQPAVLTGTKTHDDARLISFCQAVQAELDYDLVGLDVMYSHGRYYLLEANRSPLFNRYFRLTKQNIAKPLMAHIYETVSSFLPAM